MKSLIFVLFLLQIARQCSYAETQDNEGRAITRLEVKNNKAISTETILSKIKTKAEELDFAMRYFKG